MADTAAASTLTILHDGRLYRSDKQTAALLRHVQRWQASGDRVLEAALFDHGLKAGRIQPGPVAREQAETAQVAEELANGSLRIRIDQGIENAAQPAQALGVPERSETTEPSAPPSVQAPTAERRSWLNRATDTARDLLRRADQVVERWLPSPADTHFQQGATIAFRDQSTKQTRMAHVIEARQTRTLDVTGWLPTQVIAIREGDANGLTRRRELTPRELRSATLMQSASSGHASDVPERRETEARHPPVRHAADPPLRQPGSAWNTSVQQAWPATTVRDRAPEEQQHATIAWPVNQLRPLAFRATQSRGLEQGQE